MSNQVDFWHGEDGDAYHERNKFEDRHEFWKVVLDGVVPPKRIIELGCGKGENLAAIKKVFPDAEIHGVEVNKNAAIQAAKTGAIITNTSVLYLGQLGEYDLAVTRGFLIHLPTPMLLQIMDLLAGVKRNVVMVEYHSTFRREIEYRGQNGLLWADNFGRHFRRSAKKLAPKQWHSIGKITSSTLGIEDGTTAMRFRRDGK